VSENHTFYYAVEIEASIVSECWHCPERLSVIYRELDPQVHFTQPHLRWILEALDLAYRQLGTVNFETAVQVLREMNRLEDCGGLDGVNQVYKLAELGRDPVRDQKIFDSELAMLKAYAINRATEPPRAPDFFTSSKATLYLNKVKRSDSVPDYLGELQFKGRRYSVKIWRSLDGEFLNLSLQPL
jgi:hypothetical protein